MTAQPPPIPSPFIMNTYGRLPVSLSHGKGCKVWDSEGREYLDALAGIAVNTLGHQHPDFVAALQDQIQHLIHCSNYYHSTVAHQLAEKLVQLSGMKNVFFCNSGLEANEAAIKLARKYGHDRGLAFPKIVVCEKAFHGRSLATLSATGNPKVQQGFEPLVEGFIRVPFNDVSALEALAAEHPDIAALFFETIQGEGGVRPARAEYLEHARRICDQNNWLLILDEVQSGMGRTGRWFAHQHTSIQPDVMCLAKGLGSGVPIGAVVAGERAAGVLQPGNHGSTFGGNPLAMRAGFETIRLMQRDHLLANAERVGEHLQQELRLRLANVSGVLDIRGQGLMLGIELNRPCGVLTQKALDADLLISVTADTVVRLLPPLILNTAEADEIVSRLVPIIEQFLREPT